MGVGKIDEFDVKTGNWNVYCERLEMYFLANDIKDGVKLPTLIAVMGEDAYQLLSTLASPKQPSLLTFKEAVSLLKNHLQPKPSILAERYKFRQRRQAEGESVAQYVAELKKLAKTCDFGANLEENIRDQLVCGIISESTRQRLFAEDGVGYSTAVRLATTLEAAERNAVAVDRDASVTTGVHKLQTSHKCMACGEMGHRTETCKYKNFECSLCKNLGHLRRMCPDKNARLGVTGTADSQSQSRGYSVTFSGSRGRGKRSTWRGGRGRGRERGRGTNNYWVHEHQTSADYGGQSDNSGYASAREDSYGDDKDEEPMFQMSLAKYKPVCIALLVQNQFLNMEIDTGSALSCIGLHTYRKHLSDLPVQTCHLKLKFYNGSVIQPLGYLRVEVMYNKTTKILDLYVIDHGTTNLLGRQWLSELGIEIPTLTLNSLNAEKVNKTDIANEILSRHEALFDGTLGRYTGGAVRLRVRPGTGPVFCRARPVPFALRPRVDAEIDAMLDAGVIQPVTSSDWATPLVIARKADGGIRLCADYKVTLNPNLLVDRHPVPRVDDLLSNLSGHQYFTKLDLSQAYNQLGLDEESTEYTVINTHRGLFKYTRLVYGLASSPGIFQKIMEDLFKSVPDVITFYDDILITSRDLVSHVKTIEQVLGILEVNGLKIKKNKCHFLTEKVQYLGFVLDREGVRVNPEKIKPIVDMAPPRNTHELKSFLGMINFYGKFVKNLSSILTPLYALLKKGKHYTWGQEQNEAFIKVKRELCGVDVLVHFDASRVSVVTCDASSRGVGAVLAQRAPDGQERAVAYASRALTPAETHYSQIDKEALAIIFATDKFHQYLFGRNFVLRTDHKPLVSVFGPNVGIPATAASRLQRWAIKLSAYDFNIEYVNTCKNTADALSRLIKSHKEESVSTEEELPEQTYLHFASEALLLDYTVLKKQTAADPILSRVLSYVTDGWPNDADIKELKPYFNRQKEIYTELGCVMWGHRVVIPLACRVRVMNELHDAHMGVVKTKALARSYVWWPGVDEAVEAACSSCAVCASVASAPPGHAPNPWPWPHRPWARLHCDFLGPILGHSFLIVVDAGSKWIEAIRMKNTTAAAVIAELRPMWARFGLPKQVVTDNGPPFSSAEFKVFLERNKIGHIFSAPYHPASNGAAENSVKICKRAIKKAIKQKLDIDTALSRFLLAYRNTEHYSTGESPAKILQGRNLGMRLDRLKPDRFDRVNKRQIQTRAGDAGRGVRARAFGRGDDVWCRDYRSADRWVPARVTDVLGNTDYKVKCDNKGTEVHRHIDQIRRRVSMEPEKVRPQSKITPQRRNSSLVLPLADRSQLEPEECTVEQAEDGAGAGGGPPPAASQGAPNTTATVDPPKRVPKPPIRFGFEEYF